MKITIEIDDKETNSDYDPRWEGGKNICATCPNRPGGQNNKSGFCMCTIPSLYGPNRITC